MTATIDVKTFFTFFFHFGHVFYVFNVFSFSKRVFLFLKNVGKVQSGKQINKKHFQNNSNEIETYDLCIEENCRHLQEFEIQWVRK